MAQAVHNVSLVKRVIHVRYNQGTLQTLILGLKRHIGVIHDAGILTTQGGGVDK